MRKLRAELTSVEPYDTPGYTMLNYSAGYDTCFSVSNLELASSNIDIKEHFRIRAEEALNNFVFKDLSDILRKTICYIQSISCMSVYEDVERSLILKDLHKLLDDLD